MKKQLFAFTALAALTFSFSTQASAHFDYQVQKGDSLWKIAEKQNVSVEYLKKWNHLVDDLIVPNQKIRIEEGPIHTVVEGDSLNRIAVQHNVTVQNLKDWNNLYSEVVEPGQVLKTVEHRYYTVKSGDTLSEIAVANKISLNNLMRWNNLSSTLIHPGNNLIVQAGPEAPEGIELELDAGAFTAYCEGCSGVTYTGLDLRANPTLKVIAVDPAVIPLGSKVWVEGYGEAIAADIGKNIKRNRIQVFFPSEQEAIDWGRKTVKVRVLPE